MGEKLPDEETELGYKTKTAGLLCHKFEIEGCLDDFEERMKLQNLTYLLKETKLDLPFSFSLNVKGPYSEDLNESAVKAALRPEEIEDVNFEEETETTIDSFVEALGEKTKDREYLEQAAQALEKKKRVEMWPRAEIEKLEDRDYEVLKGLKKVYENID